MMIDMLLVRRFGPEVDRAKLSIATPLYRSIGSDAFQKRGGKSLNDP